MKNTSLDDRQAEKRQIRKLSLSRRDGIDAEMRPALDTRVLERIVSMDQYMVANRVLLYAAYKSEVGTEAIIEHCFSEGKEVVLPKVDEANGCLTKHIVRGMHDMCTGFKGIPEPTTISCVRVEEVDMIIVPGAAFSPSGERIGYGGGYYDKLLPRIKGVKPIIALAYEEQIFDDLPTEEHDVGMDMIITPERIITCHG